MQHGARWLGTTTDAVKPVPEVQVWSNLLNALHAVVQLPNKGLLSSKINVGQHMRRKTSMTPWFKFLRGNVIETLHTYKPI